MNKVLRFSPKAPPEMWRWHYHTLLRLRAALVHEHQFRSAALRELHEVGGRDQIDLAGDLQDQDELLTELAVEEVELSEVDAALERLRNGTYGICEASGKPIPERRLRVIPWARFTQQVASLHETPVIPFHEPSSRS